jgi:hypothetical protein
VVGLIVWVGVRVGSGGGVGGVGRLAENFLNQTLREYHCVAASLQPHTLAKVQPFYNLRNVKIETIGIE